MNLFGHSHESDPRSEHRLVSQASETGISLPTIIGECRTQIKIFTDLCSTINEKSAALGKVQERYDALNSTVEDTRRAYQKELVGLKRCEKFQLLSARVWRSLQPRLVESVQELILQARTIANKFPELQLSCSELKVNKQSGSEYRESLTELWSLSNALNIFSKLFLNYLKDVPAVNLHPHVLCRFEGGALQGVVRDFAFFNAELARVRAAIEKIFSITDRAQSVIERADEYQTFAQEFTLELERLQVNSKAVGDEKQMLINERKLLVQGAQKIFSDTRESFNKIADDLLLVDPSLSELIGQTRIAMQNERRLADGETQQGSIVRAQSAMGLLTQVIERCEKTLSAPNIEAAASLKQDQVKIRLGSPKDMVEVINIERQCFEIPWQPNDITAFLDRDNRFLWCAESGERVIAFVFGVSHERSIEIISVAVDPRFQRRGVGTGLLEKAIRDLAESNRDSISLVVRERNVDAQLFFKKLGFRVMQSITGYFSDSDETGYQMVYKREV
jgi:ribosomal-protein-alanine N-acetyltransferase